MRINGGQVDFACVSPVASSPLYRRRGHTGAMLRRSLKVMKDRGQPIAGLYTPHPALYRRYGWEIAASSRGYSFKPKDLRLLTAPAQRGRFRMLKKDDWQSLDRIHTAYVQPLNGPFSRGNERQWQDVLEVPWRRVDDIVVWQNDAGVTEGYALYYQPGQGRDANRLLIWELVTLSGDAYLNLMGYFASHDLHSEITIHRGPDDKLLLLFADAERLDVKENFTVMLRVCDFEAAMRARPAAREDEICEVTVAIEDQDAPWNNGVWRVGVAEGRTWAEPAQAAPELALTARVLGPLFNGYAAPSAAAESGLLSATSSDALHRADRIFAATRPPFFMDAF
jgi:predicted acetyltransferase